MTTQFEASNNRLPLVTNEITQELKRKAEEELFETDETKATALAALRCLVAETHKYPFPLSDAILLQFLRGRKFDLERAHRLTITQYQVMKKYVPAKHLNSRTTLSELLSQMIKITEDRGGCLDIYPERDDDGCVLISFNIETWEEEWFPMENVIVLAIFLPIILNRYPATQIAGVKIIGDYRGLTLKQLISLNIWHFQAVFEILQSFMPLRMKGFHLLGSTTFSTLWTMVKIALPKKLKNRVFLHGKNTDGLQKHISPSILPKEYGGTYGRLNGSYLHKLLKESEPYLLDYFANVLLDPSVPK